MEELEVKRLENETETLAQRAESINVENKTDMECADSFLRTLKALKKKVEGHFAPHVENAHKAWKALTQDRKEHIDPIDEAIKVVGRKMFEYNQEEIRRGLEQKRKAEEAARAEEDRKRKIKEEQERKWREQQRQKEEEARRLEKEGKDEEARKAKEAADKAAQRAEDRREEAENIFVAPTMVQEEKAETKTVFREHWTAEVTDHQKAISACLSNPMLEHLVIIDDKALKALARSQKRDLRINGVKMWNIGSVA